MVSTLNLYSNAEESATDPQSLRSVDFLLRIEIMKRSRRSEISIPQGLPDFTLSGLISKFKGGLARLAFSSASSRCHLYLGLESDCVRKAQLHENAIHKVASC